MRTKIIKMSGTQYNVTTSFSGKLTLVLCGAMIAIAFDAPEITTRPLPSLHVVAAPLHGQRNVAYATTCRDGRGLGTSCKSQSLCRSVTETFLDLAGRVWNPLAAVDSHATWMLPAQTAAAPALLPPAVEHVAAPSITPPAVEHVPEPGITPPAVEHVPEPGITPPAPAVEHDNVITIIVTADTDADNKWRWAALFEQAVLDHWQKEAVDGARWPGDMGAHMALQLPEIDLQVCKPTMHKGGPSSECDEGGRCCRVDEDDGAGGAVFHLHKAVVSQPKFFANRGLASDRESLALPVAIEVRDYFGELFVKVITDALTTSADAWYLETMKEETVIDDIDKIVTIPAGGARWFLWSGGL